MNLVGYRKQWRKIWDNPIIAGHPNRFIVWSWILDHVMWKEDQKVRFNNETINLKRGQITTGAYLIANETGVPRGTVERIIKLLKSEEQIEVQTDRQCSLITVKNWDQYQINEEQSEEGMRNDRGTSEERVRTKEESNNNYKNDKNVSVVSHDPTPRDIMTDFIQNESTRQEWVQRIIDKGVPEHVAREEIKKFARYWSELSLNGKKQKWEGQKTFELSKRLWFWLNKVQNYSPHQKS